MICEISSDNICLKISSSGAEIRELKLHKSAHNWIWPSLNPWKRSAPILFPIVGRLKRDKYHYESKEFTLSQHGFARDSDFSLVEKSEKSALLRLCESADSLKKYPFCFELDVEYSLEDDRLRVVFTVKNRDHKRMYFNIGWHPAFVLPGQNLESPLNLKVSPHVERYQTLEDGLLKDETFSLQNNQGFLQLHAETVSRDALIFRNCGLKQLNLRDALENKIEMSCNAPHLGVWTKDVSKFVCLEPWWGYADSQAVSGVLTEKPGIQSLAPCDAWSSEIIVTVRNSMRSSS